MITPTITMKRGALAGARRRVERLEEVLSDLSPTFEAIHPYLLTHQLKQAKSEGTHGGAPWVLLGFPRDAVKDLLMPALTSDTHPDHVFVTGAQEMKFGARSRWVTRLFDGNDKPERIFAMTSRQRTKFNKLILADLIERAHKRV